MSAPAAYLREQEREALQAAFEMFSGIQDGVDDASPESRAATHHAEAIERLLKREGIAA